MLPLDCNLANINKPYEGIVRHVVIVDMYNRHTVHVCIIVTYW